MQSKKDLLFFQEHENYFYNDKPLKSLNGIQSLNLIIGANNSGKSRFIRDLIKMDFRILDNEECGELNRLFEGFEELMPECVDELKEIKKSIISEKSLVSLRKIGNLPCLSNLDNEEINREVNRKITEYRYPLLRKAIYIPALRTAHTLYDKANKPIIDDFFKRTLDKNHSISSMEKVLYDMDIDIFTGINLYEELREARNSETNVRKKLKDFERFLSLNFYYGKEVEIVAIDTKSSNGSRKINVHIENLEDKDIYDLGDGVQAIIILMYKIFMADDNTLIVIDEPEQHLHPGLQRVFMEATLQLLKERDNNVIVFIVTHSNHLMDMTLTKDSVSIYSFSKDRTKKDSKTSVRACKAGDYSLLSDLGVNSSSAFIANSSVWIEGPTDRKYLKFFLNKYLEKMDKHLKEDIDYAFYEYGGSLIAHYDFNEEDEAEALESGIKAFALANRIFLLADRDSTEVGGSDKKSERLDRFEKIAEGVENFHFEKTKGIEIENMLPASVYKDFIHELYNGEKSSVVEAKIGSLVTTDYEDEKIGAFLFSILEKSKVSKDKIKSIETSSGTLQTSLKTKLCNDVCDSYSEIPYDKLVDSGSGLDLLIKTLHDFVVNE